MKLLLEYKVPPNEDGLCAEYFLKKRLDISSGLLCELKYNGKIFINGEVCRTVDVARCGDVVAADVYEEIGGFGNIKPYETELDVVYEDDYIFVVINDSSKRRELIKNIPKFCGVFCNSNVFGLGQVTQIFRYPSDCHKKRINIIKRFKALLIRN